ncbi:MAG: hypothetical protein GY862_26135, partial [Gammaproteobacteria bacterium]|nr:hypothetical protein [Gammaproteobacteria bacterium]
DHHYTDRAGINADTLARALNQLPDSYDDWLKIAVWHHPVSGPQTMKNVDFLQQLAVHGFQICMHGHVHEAAEGFYKYDSGRGIHIVGAGTFGAPADDQVTGIPLQYNLLILNTETNTLTVETRKKEKPDGVWAADARWGDKTNPVPRYTVTLKPDILESAGFKLESEQKQALIDAVLDCPAIRNRGARDAVMEELPGNIKNSIQRSSPDRIDVTNIVLTCLDYPDGLEALIDNLRFFEGKSASMQTLDKLYREIQAKQAQPGWIERNRT